MPRNGRIEMVGKREGWERVARAEETAELERELRRQWRRRRADEHEELIVDSPEPSPGDD